MIGDLQTVGPGGLCLMMTSAVGGRNKWGNQLGGNDYFWGRMCYEWFLWVCVAYWGLRPCGDLDEARLEHCRVFSTVLFQPSFWIIRCSGMSAFSRDLIDWVGTSPFSPCFLGPDLNAPDLTDRLLEVKNTKNISAKCYFMSWNKRKGSRYRIMHHG